MILAGLLAFSIFPGRFVEDPVPTAKATIIEAAIVFPYLTRGDRAIEEVIGASLLEGTADYTKVQMRRVTVNMGEPLRCVCTPDCLRITIGVRPEDWKVGLRILRSLLTSPDLSDESVEKAKATLPFLNASPWKAAYDPTILHYDKVGRREIVDFMRRNVVPQATSVVVSGSYPPGEPRSFWTEELGDWSQANPLRFPADKGWLHLARRPDQALSILRWNGPEIAPSGVRLVAPLLAAFALGIGKESAVFRVIREKERLSYRQEVVLAPYGDGFRLQLITVFLPRVDESGLPAQMKQDMLADIDSWTEETRKRAVEMARAALVNRAFAVPLAITPDGSLGSDDRVFLAAYWPMKTGQPWKTREMMQALESVPLEELKSVSRDLFEKGEVVQSQ